MFSCYQLISHICLGPTAFMSKLYEMSVESYVPHAVFVTFIGLTSLRTDSGKGNLYKSLNS